MSVWNGTLSQRRNLNPTRSRQGTPGMTNCFVCVRVSHSAKFDPLKNYDVLAWAFVGPSSLLISWAFVLSGSRAQAMSLVVGPFVTASHRPVVGYR
ncbi:hypothetical protein TorRG33x02_167780 [Trema orientale]|uniref:Uncharacterized protein n=1 Tax=Trema orientale TaxID=63057 RepID=A0A2P5EPM6_TREOI|nr:hypothetical protein TorRG33x02_167780 [Trema orientale]